MTEAVTYDTWFEWASTGRWGIIPGPDCVARYRTLV